VARRAHVPGAGGGLGRRRLPGHRHAEVDAAGSAQAHVRPVGVAEQRAGDEGARGQERLRADQHRRRADGRLHEGQDQGLHRRRQAAGAGQEAIAATCHSHFVLQDVCRSGTNDIFATPITDDAGRISEFACKLTPMESHLPTPSCARLVCAAALSIAAGAWPALAQQPQNTVNPALVQRSAPPASAPAAGAASAAAAAMGAPPVTTPAPAPATPTPATPAPEGSTLGAPAAPAPAVPSAAVPAPGTSPFSAPMPGAPPVIAPAPFMPPA